MFWRIVGILGSKVEPVRKRAGLAAYKPIRIASANQKAPLNCLENCCAASFGSQPSSLMRRRLLIREKQYLIGILQPFMGPFNKVWYPSCATLIIILRKLVRSFNTVCAEVSLPNWRISVVNSVDPSAINCCRGSRSERFSRFSAFQLLLSSNDGNDVCTPIMFSPVELTALCVTACTSAHGSRSAPVTSAATVCPDLSSARLR